MNENTTLYVVPTTTSQLIGGLALIGAIAIGSVVTRGFQYIRDQYLAKHTAQK